MKKTHQILGKRRMMREYSPRHKTQYFLTPEKNQSEYQKTKSTEQQKPKWQKKRQRNVNAHGPAAKRQKKNESFCLLKKSNNNINRHKKRTKNHQQTAEAAAAAIATW